MRHLRVPRERTVIPSIVWQSPENASNGRPIGDTSKVTTHSARSLFSLSVVVAAITVGAIGALGCHAEVKVNASTDDTDHSDPPAAPASTPAPVTAAAPVAPSTPPADACPLLCYEARGSVRGEVTAEEATQLRSSLEPVLGRMRQCTSADDWRRHGSPTINLRIAPDGTLAEMGVDPSHGSSSSCFDDIGRNGNATLSLPGRKVVRCAERCGVQSHRRASR